MWTHQMPTNYLQRLARRCRNIRKFSFLSHATSHLFSLPVVKVSLGSIFGSTKSKRSVVSRRSAPDDPWFESESGGFFSEDEFQFKEFDPSVSNYPSPYCKIVEGKYSLWLTC